MDSSSPCSSRKIFRRSTIVFIVLATGLLTNSSYVTAQEKGRFDVEAYLKRIDENQNGRLDPDEMTGRTEGFIKGMGFDTSSSISVQEIIDKINKDRKDRETNENKSNQKATAKILKVPGFGVSSGGTAVPGFGLSDVQPAATKFSDSVERQVDETLDRYDRNNDGILDGEELKGARWGNPRPEESDTNRDGKISRMELANRYYAREQSVRESTSQAEPDGSSGRSSGDDSRSNDRGRSGRSNSSRGDTTTFSSQYSSSPSTTSSRGTSNSSPSSSYASGGSSTESSTSETSSADNREKYAKYAESLIKNYDKDSDGKLSKNEVKTMRRPPVGADGDKDGFITETELIDSLSGDQSAKPDAGKGSEPSKKPESNLESSSESSSARTPKPSSSGRSGGSFSTMDTNQDNQVEMHEFSTDWNDEAVTEFYAKDRNGDGVITMKEWTGK